MDLTAALAAAGTPATETSACADHSSSLCSYTWRLTHDSGVSQVFDDLSKWLDIAAIIAIAWVVHILVRRLIKRTVRGLQGDVAQRRLSMLRRATPSALLNTNENPSLRRVQRAATIGALLRSASTVIIVVATLFSVLGRLNFNLSTLFASTAVATAVLGFGAQNIVRDFLAGFFIVVEDQYGVGDVIDLGTFQGTVEAVSLRITSARDDDGTLWHVPNGEIKKVGNMSQSWARAVVEFNLNLDTDIPTAADVVKRVADAMWRDAKYAGVITGEPDVRAPNDITADGISIKVAVRTRPHGQWTVSRDLRLGLKKAFDEAGIRVATALADAYDTPTVEGRSDASS